jgi:predicted ester cyclase
VDISVWMGVVFEAQPHREIGAAYRPDSSISARRGTDGGMAANPTEDLVRSFHQELWGAGDVSAIDRYVASDAVVEMTGSEGATVEVLRADVERYVAAFDEVTTEIVDLVAHGDRAALWWRTSGRHVGPYGDIAPEPTGARITMEGIDFMTVVDHRIVAMRSFWDAAAVYRQFGLLPRGL